MRKALSVFAIACAFAIAPAASAQPEAEAKAGPADAPVVKEEGEHAPEFSDVNWYYGVLGEKDGVEPSLFYRPRGMPVPYAALLFDSLILYYLLYRLFGRGIVDGLRKRKENLLRGMQEAAKMKQDAEAQLEGYQQKLAKIDTDIARIQTQTRHAAELESKRLLEEAKERRARMERDAHLLVEQELKAVREGLIQTMITSALASAESTLEKKLQNSDQERFAEEYLASLKSRGASLRGRL